MIAAMRAHDGHAQPTGLFDDRLLRSTPRRRPAAPARSPGGSPHSMSRRGRGRGRHPRQPRPAARRFAVADEATAFGAGEAARPVGWLPGSASGPRRPAEGDGFAGDGRRGGAGRVIGAEAPSAAPDEALAASVEAVRAEAPSRPAASAAGGIPAAGSGHGGGPAVEPAPVGVPAFGAPAIREAGEAGEAGGSEPGRGRSVRSSCSPSQLRRFIKSRPYVPLHELRRRFGIDGAEDDVVRIEVDGRGLFVGLPRREAEMLRDLVRNGDVGVELLLDPESPVVVGVYPMRPVPRN